MVGIDMVVRIMLSIDLWWKDWREGKRIWRVILMFLWIFWCFEVVEDKEGVRSKGGEEVCLEGLMMDMVGIGGLCDGCVWEKLLWGMINLVKLGFEFEGDVCFEGVVKLVKGVGGWLVWFD